MKKWALGALLLTVSISATAAERVALVIGNSAYPSNWLPNPVNDATDLSAVLKKLNFVVIPVLNGNKTVMNSKIHQFLQNINSQTKVALFFYSGHGSQYRGTNYLIPVDANLQNATTLPSSSVTAQSILSKMNTRRAGLNIMVIDACRTSPYQGVANITYIPHPKTLDV
ncbi:caspase family protein [Lutibacter sp.]